MMLIQDKGITTGLKCDSRIMSLLSCSNGFKSVILGPTMDELARRTLAADLLGSFLSDYVLFIKVPIKLLRDLFV